MSTMTSKGQVTVPIAIRERLGLHSGDEVEFVLAEDGSARLVKSPNSPGRGRRVVEHLRGRGDVRMSTDEIMALTRGE